MREIDDYHKWAESVIGKYNESITEGYDDLNPVTGSISKDEIDRFRANKPIKSKTPEPKNSGPSPEIREKLKNLRAEFAAKAKIGEEDLSEADQPPQGSLYSPLSAANRQGKTVDHKIKAKQQADERRMKKWMGHQDQ
jgi:hypothetical protein